jgi:hypothetical protein
MQRAALEKLNQKRKWYQQQLEAERMMSKSIAKSKQVGRNGAGWLLMANDVLRGSQLPVRFALVLKPVCVPAAVGFYKHRSWHGVPASWQKRTAVQLLLLLLLRLVAHICKRIHSLLIQPPVGCAAKQQASTPERTHRAGATAWLSSKHCRHQHHAVQHANVARLFLQVVWLWIGLERGCHPCTTKANGTCG